MSQTVSRRPLTAKTRVRIRASPCKTCCGQRGTEYLARPLASSLHPYSVLIFIYTLLLPGGQTGEGPPGPPQKQCSFINRGALDRQILSLCLQRLSQRVYPCTLRGPVRRRQQFLYQALAIFCSNMLKVKSAVLTTWSVT